MILDKDLASIQEVRDLLATSKKAQQQLATFPQEKINDICHAIANACYENREKLAKMAHEETGFGIWQDKVVKNTFGSKIVFTVKVTLPIYIFKIEHTWMHRHTYT